MTEVPTMFAAISRFREKLNHGEVCLGAGITLADSSIVEALAPALEFVWIDLEHTHLSYETVQSHLIAARAGGIAALVRVRGSDAPHIKPVLDIGAGGIVVPQVRSADEVRQVVAACRYAPLGERGYGPRRASNYSREGGQKWMQQANESMYVGVQIENLPALEAVEEIASSDGLDAIVLGPYDLSVAMGFPGEIGHPRVQTEIKRIIGAARQNGKHVGTGLGGVAAEARKMIDLGVQWLQCGDDYSYMVREADALMREIREGAKG